MDGRKTDKKENKEEEHDSQDDEDGCGGFRRGMPWYGPGPADDQRQSGATRSFGSIPDDLRRNQDSRMARKAKPAAAFVIVFFGVAAIGAW